MAFGALIGAIGSVAGSAIQANAQKQGAEDLGNALDVQGRASELGLSLDDVFGTRLEPPEFDFEFDPERIFDLADRTIDFNRKEGLRYSRQAARKINTRTLKDLERGMRRLFGGGDTFNRLRDLTNENTENLLEGNVSDSSQRLLARRSLRAGASGIGPDAVDDVYTTYLGLTTEDNITRGTEIYRSLYATYRQAFPLTTGLQTMPFFSLDPNAGINVGILGEQLGFQTAQANYESQLNQALASAAPDPVASGLLNAELQRGAAEAGANLQANSAQGSLISTAANSIGGVVRGISSQNTGGGGGFNFGSFGGVQSQI